MHVEKSRSVVLTGATGFLGAFLMSGLLERGYRVVVLGRPSTNMSLSGRLSSLVRWLGIDPRGRLSSVEVDFSRENLGLDDDTYKSLCNGTDKIIHCASDTSFLERDRKRVMETNVQNLAHIVDFVVDSRASHLYYISSAYACGVCDGICTETPVTGGIFTNVYEESKAQAEEILRKSCENKVPLTIFRPSIVYGHSKTGKALKFNALYYAVKSLLYVRDIFVKDIAEHGGERSKKWGFYLDDEGILHLSLAVHLSNKGTVNLISVDYFAETVLRIMERSEAGNIYHIISENPPDISALIEYSERFLGIRGVRAVWDVSNEDPNPAEELLDRFLGPYRPYLSDKRIFDRSHTNLVIPKLPEPIFTCELFTKCMAYAKACDWGRIDGFPK